MLSAREKQIVTLGAETVGAMYERQQRASEAAHAWARMVMFAALHEATNAYLDSPSTNGPRRNRVANNISNIAGAL